MNGLIIFFSRTGRTQKVADAIQRLTGFHLEQIKEKVGRGGPIGWLKSGMESTRQMIPKIMPLAHDPSQYNIVILGTPIWASNMSSPMRAFLTEYENKITKIAIFCTGDGDKPEKVFNSISEFLGKEPLSTLGLIGPDRDEMVASLKIQEFVAILSE